MSAQLSLALRLRDDATFANFLPLGTNRIMARDWLSSDSPPGVHLVYLWGAPGAGISHLAQAVCHHYNSSDRPSQYLPLAELAGVDAESLLEGLERQSLTCLEDIHLVGGNGRWERALFNFYNRLTGTGNLLLVAANCPPTALPFDLKDLVSRLSSGLVLHLPPYSDEEKVEILRFRASRLGLELGEDVASYLLNRSARDLEGLMDLLRHLDAASLAAKRRLTVPFVRQVMGW